MTTTASGVPAAGSLQYQEGIAWLVLDEPGKKVNTLSSRTLIWLENHLAELEADPPRGLVLLSGKRAGFVAGADLEELAGFSDPEGVTRLLKRGHALLGRLEGLPFPTVAAIHGACLGGGLELALGCTWRVATEAPETRLGLPEVQLGLIPGLGGTQRLPRLIGVPAALDLIATGRAIDARRARSLGLVDETCHRANLESAAVGLLGRRPPRRRLVGFGARAVTFLAKVPVAGALVFAKARREIQAKTGGHYPAPLAAVAVMASGLPKPLPRGLEVESEAFARLVVTPAAKHLMAIFFMKNDVEARAAKLAETARPAIRKGTARVGVLGAGFMGAGIAQSLAAKGVSVVLKDRDLPALSRGMKQAAGLFADLGKRRRLPRAELATAIARLHGSTDLAAFRGVDLVIEAVFEDLDLKHAVLREVEAVAPERMIFASNTSTLPIADIARVSRRPENVVGMHFFSPVHKMPLLEVIRQPKTGPMTVATAVEIGRQLGKTVIVVGDGPGFFTTRVLAPFLNEAAWCLTEGASVEQIDTALTRWGWPAGGLALMDEVGLDIGLHVGGVMRAAFGERIEAPAVLEKLVAAGRLGRKSGRGFYLYSGKAKKVDRSLYPLLGWQPAEIAAEEIADRCFLAMLNETARTLEEGIIGNPIDVDIGVLFGFGFPAFRGGILREAERQGLSRIVDRLERYADRLGTRFRPTELLRSMAASGSTFYRQT